MQSEWRWFGATVRDALVRPRRFAAALAREHFGLAGVLVVIFAGIALSITVDAVVILSKDADPLADPTRLVFDAFFLGLRATIVVALVALVAIGAARLARVSIDMEQAFTALSFATTPLVLAPVVIVPMALAASLPASARTPLVAIAFVAAILLLLRFLAGVALNLAALVHRAAIFVGIVAVIAFGLVMQDQVARVFFTTLTYAPQVLPAPAPDASDGRDARVEAATFRVPAEWHDAQRGVPGVAANYEQADARFVVRVVDVSTLTTADSFASSQVQTVLRDFTHVDRTERGLVRIDRAVALDDRWYGTVQATRLIERQYAFVLGTRGYVFEFTYYTPTDAAASLAQAARIAASIRLSR